MTTTTADNADAMGLEERTGRSLWGEAYRRLRRDKVAVLCFAVILAYTVIAFVGAFTEEAWKASYDYQRINEGPSWEYWLGTDALGRSVAWKLILGASVSMQVGFYANIVAVPIGMLLGAIAGYYGRFLDDFIVWVYTTLVCIPGVIRVIALKFAFQDMVFWENTAWRFELAGLPAIIIALAMTRWIGTCRLVRAETMKLRELDYVVASRASGRSGLAILTRHILPNVVHIGIINFSLGFVGAISAEVFLSFLGIGVDDQPSWGKMISEAKMDLIVGRWWEVTAATVAMFILVLAWNLFGDRLRDALDPRLRTE